MNENGKQDPVVQPDACPLRVEADPRTGQMRVSGMLAGRVAHVTILFVDTVTNQTMMVGPLPMRDQLLALLNAAIYIVFDWHKRRAEAQGDQPRIIQPGSYRPQ